MSTDDEWRRLGYNITKGWRYYVSDARNTHAVTKKIANFSVVANTPPAPHGSFFHKYQMLASAWILP